MYGLYLTLKPYRVLALETSVTQNTTAKEGGVFDREKLRSCTYKFSSQNIRKSPIKVTDIQSPLHYTSISSLCLTRYNHTSLFQRETDLPLQNTLLKPGFPLQNHP